MDRPSVAIRQTLIEHVRWYAAPGAGSTTHFMANHDANVYGVVSIPEASGISTEPVLFAVLARIVDDHIIIEADNTDKPLVDRLVAAGILRERIIRAYAGEAVPDMS